MKPLRIFIFLATVALYLVLLALIFPRQGISVSPGIRLKFMDLSDLRRSEVSKEKVVEQLLATATVSEDPEAEFQLPLEETIPAVTTGSGSSGSNVPAVPDPGYGISGTDTLIQVAPANADSLKGALFPIEFEGGRREVLHPFFRKLDALQRGELKRTRIMHFGDSQIENDRMTALIRYRLQRQFGGSGTGLVQAIPLYGGSLAYRQEEKGDWHRYTFFGRSDSTITHRVYGPMGAFAAVPPPEGREAESESESGPGSKSESGLEPGSGPGPGLEPGSGPGPGSRSVEGGPGEWPALEYRFNQKRRTGRFDRVRVHMHAYVEGGTLAFTLNDSLSDTIGNIPAGFSVAGYGHHENIAALEIAFRLEEGGRIYGISFESDTGLQVDNIAMRGGSGLIFSKMNREQQLKMLEQLRPGLLILQYGGNVVPYINAERYSWKFRKELEFLKDLCPGVPIIVIGPSDMSTKEKGEFVSFPGVEPVRDALRTATLEAGFGFWDLYQAMGGHNSMPSFVHADPPLASTDYVHFTPLGVNLVAEMFHRAFMSEYAAYKQLYP